MRFCIKNDGCNRHDYTRVYVRGSDRFNCPPVTILSALSLKAMMVHPPLMSKLISWVLGLNNNMGSEPGLVNSNAFAGDRTHRGYPRKKFYKIEAGL